MVNVGKLSVDFVYVFKLGFGEIGVLWWKLISGDVYLGIFLINLFWVLCYLLGINFL